MDEHFRTAPFARNLPVLKALLTVWNVNFLGAASTAVLPYEQYLERFPAYLQQLAMESNGKRVRLDGTAVDHDTCPVWWGEPGTNGQHSFYQLLHRGTRVVPVDLLAFERPVHEVGRHHAMLLANVVAQGEARSAARPPRSARRAPTSSPPRVRGQPSVEHAPPRTADAPRARHARRVVRAS
jgi:glucose-6-phosphate isomerase